MMPQSWSPPVTLERGARTGLDDLRAAIRNGTFDDCSLVPAPLTFGKLAKIYARGTCWRRGSRCPARSTTG
jgi:hypothetical protein